MRSRLSVPAPSERLHSGLPCCLISVRRRPVLVIPVSQRPHPRCPRWRCGGLKNAPDDHSVSTDHVIIVIALSAGATRLSSSEQQAGHRFQSSCSLQRNPRAGAQTQHVPIARDYSRASQSFLIARLTRAINRTNLSLAATTLIKSAL